ncbi:ribonuclease HI family protein, partial [Methylicorpusculum sp.]|uniref:ribonuclease HI family protein n=1 Tax=Methylicorpusculum sp. TaxID=2713644 RepID=UPI002ABA867C
MMKQLHLFDVAPTVADEKQADSSAKKNAYFNAVGVAPKDMSAGVQIKQSDPKESEVRAPQKKKSSGTHWKLFVDGAARNNPGPAGAGFYLLKDSAFSAKKGYYLGSRTNNQAEYLALLLGLNYLKNHVKPGDCVHIVSDSQLLVRQLKGEYKIKSAELRPFYGLAHALMQVVRADIFHVLRTDNEQADRMANKGIDTKREVPEDFVKMLHAHGISW